MDQRDDLTWIAIELTRQGEAKVEDGTITRTLRVDLEVESSHEIFVPSEIYRKGNRQVTLHLMEGYVFVASGLPETRYFGLERKPYVGQVMSTLGGPHMMRVPSVIPNSNVEALRKKLRGLTASDIEIGASVKITEGKYRGIDGEVWDLEGENAIVYIGGLRSILIIATIPKMFLEVVDPDETFAALTEASCG